MAVSKQWTILQSIKDIIEGATSNIFVGYSPDDVENIGNWSEAALIEGGDERYEQYPGSQMNCEIDINLFIYSNAVVNRLNTITELSREIMDVVLDDLSVGGAAIEIVLNSVEKGSNNTGNVDYYSPGIYPELTVYKQSYTVTFFDTRS
jgi:hypothetical protein